MLDVAKAKAPLADAAAIEYLQSPATPLSAPTGAFDAVLCQQGLQFFPDKAGALKEMHRVLKPKGRAPIEGVPVLMRAHRVKIKNRKHPAMSNENRCP
jgi:ubiquinone/menaquinone biosynthesis C-methylase UbiE